MTDLSAVPMGCLDALDVGPKKLTVQTEFFQRPTWRLETKVYFAGALKKVFTEDLSAMDPANLQKYINDFHQQKLEEIVASLKNLNR
jgi:hypothetical protein